MSTEEKQLLTRIEKKLDRLLNERKSARAEWIDTSAFMARAGKTAEQVRYMRTSTNPELFKPKPGTSNRYLINWTAYSNI